MILNTQPVFQSLNLRHLGLQWTTPLFKRHAWVLGRLDYCNGLLAGCTSSTLHRLQRVQDAAARLVCGAAARAHARPLLQQLHWLPIDSRIQYKLCTLMFDVQHGTAPVYLTKLCERCSDNRLRSSSRDFCIPRTNLRLSDKAFSVTGQRAWNSLPTSVRLTATKSTFCKHLKSHRFRVSYGHLS